MNRLPFSESLFKKVPLIGIIRNLSAEQVKAVVPLLQEVGWTTLEVTLNTPHATDLIRYAAEQTDGNMNIGAGTVCTVPELEQALEAGAQFIVTPIINEGVIEVCTQRRIPIFVGAFTPSEVYRAWALGAYMVKVFPTTGLGPTYIKDLKGPLNHIPMVPTGGVNLQTMQAFFKAGASGLGLGSQLFDAERIANRDWDGLKQHFRQYIHAIPGDLSF